MFVPSSGRAALRRRLFVSVVLGGSLVCVASVLPHARADSPAATDDEAAPRAALLTQAQVLSLPPGPRPVPVQPRFRLLSVHHIDDESETLEFSGALTLSWRDTRQAFDPRVEGVEEKLFHGNYQFDELSPAWYPQAILANAAGAMDMQGVVLRVTPDGTCTLMQGLHATIRFPMQLGRYPFDAQVARAEFVVLGFADTEVALVPDDTSVVVDMESLRVPQWDVLGVTGAAVKLPIPRLDIRIASSSFVVSIQLARRSMFMVRLVLLPLFLIVLLSWSVFWMDRSSLGDRMSVSFVGILTAVSYQILVSSVMPQIADVTFMNAFLSLSFLLMSATVVVNLVVGALDKRGDNTRGDRVDRACRWLFPLLYLGLILATTGATLGL